MRSAFIYIFIYVFLASQLAGCATASQSGADTAVSLAQKMAKDRDDEKGKAQNRVRDLGGDNSVSSDTKKYWQTVQSDCATALSGLDKQANTMGNWQLWIAIAGLFSGVIGASWAAAGTHAKAAVAAASGIAGAANTAQTSIQTYKFDAQDLQTTASNLRAQIIQNGKAFNAATTDSAALNAAEDTAISCEFFSYQKSAAQK